MWTGRARAGRYVVVAAAGMASYVAAGCGDDLNSAEYRTLLGQLNAGEYANAYQWLHPAQKEWILPERFAACYANLGTGAPESRIVDVESVEVDRETKIPGRDGFSQSVDITATVETRLGNETARETRTVHLFSTGPLQSLSTPPRPVMDAATFDGASEGMCEGRTPPETIG